MQTSQFRHVLRSAVIAAIPVISQTGCGTTDAINNTNSGVNTAQAETNGNEVVNPFGDNEGANGGDSCRTGETTIKSGQERYSFQSQLITPSLNAEQCLERCKQAFIQGRIGGINDLVKLERLSAGNCTSEDRPYTNVVPGGQMATPSTLVSCDVEYTAQHSPYTCPRPVVGRIPNGMHMDVVDTQKATTPDSIGEYLADMAAMETAAITAFRYLRRELEAYNAPAELIARARAAVVEETRHAEMARLLSTAYDTEVPTVTVDDFELRSLYEIALENAVEGCVNETFAAACGLWQSEHAQLDVFREVIAHISDEETGHAALSWDIHAWAMPQLTEMQQAKVIAAQTAALDKLMTDFKQEGNPLLQRAFGLPTRGEAARLFGQLKATVWATLLPANSAVLGECRKRKGELRLRSS